jgi:hypothetical protein
MKNTSLKATFAGLMLAVSGLTNATLILEGGTGTTGVGNILLSGGATMVDVSNSNYDNSVTTPESDWIWDSASSNGSANPLEFTFSFSLVGFDVSTANLSGLWGIDNVGSASLNGNVISDLQVVMNTNFNSLTAIAAGPGSAFFQTGLNVLTFNVANLGGAAGFRASVQVTADETVLVAEPTTLAILGLSLMGLASRRFKKKL